MLAGVGGHWQFLDGFDNEGRVTEKEKLGCFLHWGVSDLSVLLFLAHYPT